LVGKSTFRLTDGAAASAWVGLEVRGAAPLTAAECVVFGEAAGGDWEFGAASRMPRVPPWRRFPLGFSDWMI
jgi:hypothetical protein